MSVPAASYSRRRRKQPRYWLRRLLVILLLLLPVLVWQGWAFLKELPLIAEGSAPRVESTKPVYVAIMGVDERANDIGRSDTLILVRLDPKSDRLDVVNLPRDTRVQIEGEMHKLNAAYALGGPTEVTEVLESFLGIDRPYYVTVNFKAFEELVTAVGGVPMTLDRDYAYEDPYQDLYIDLKAGQQIMDGRTALHYVRLRYDGVTNSDVARIERQQEFLQALLGQLSANWTRVPGMIKIMRKYVRTNIPEADQLGLAKLLWDARENVAMQTLPGSFSDDAYGDWLLDEAGWKELTQSWLNP